MLFLRKPHGNSGVRNLDACMTGEAGAVAIAPLPVLQVTVMYIKFLIRAKSEEKLSISHLFFF